MDSWTQSHHRKRMRGEVIGQHRYTDPKQSALQYVAQYNRNGVLEHTNARAVCVCARARVCVYVCVCVGGSMGLVAVEEVTHHYHITTLLFHLAGSGPASRGNIFSMPRSCNIACATSPPRQSKGHRIVAGVASSMLGSGLAWQEDATMRRVS